MTNSEPDYTVQGSDNGSQKADDDNAAIISLAQTDAQVAGNADGNAGKLDNPIPDASTTCDKTFTYATPQPQEYVNTFHDSYLEACSRTYESAYNDAYETAYQAGTDVKQASDQQAATLQDASGKTDDNSGYWWIAGLGLIGVPALVSWMRKK